MPARIYALAKELNLDSKDLVEIVKKVGITGKGSALASLTDDEEKKVREHLSGDSGQAPAPKKAPPSNSPMGAVRDSVVPAARKQVSIKSKKAAEAESSSREAAESANSIEPEVAAESAEEVVVADSTPPPAPVDPEKIRDAFAAKPDTPAEKPNSSSKPAGGRASGLSARRTSGPSNRSEPKPPRKPARGENAEKGGGRPGMARGIADRMAARQSSGTSTPTAPIRNESAGGGNRMRSLDRSGGGKKEGPKKDGESKGAKRREPRINVKMAALPDVADTPAPKADKEVKAQRPDVKLSPDVIAGAKKGVGASLDELAKREEDKKRGGKAGGLKGFTGDRKEEDDDKPRKRGLAGMASSRAERVRGKSRGRVSLDGNPTLDRMRHQRRGGPKRKGVNTAAPRKEAVSLEMPASIRSFSEATGVAVGRVLGTMMQMGLGDININSQMDFDSAELIAAELGIEIQLKAAETLEDALISEMEEREDAADSLVPRAPVVTFLGHVDHGKTSLLDYLIGTEVTAGEAGGITQHIRAYQIPNDGRPVTFVDTPGHEAFTEMRARGANVTDIAVLVVAADDGIMPQTEEAISHAKAAGVPIVVALNKIDLEGVDATRALTQLTEHELTPSEWGGDTEVVRTSATKGTGMDELLETLLTIAELNEYSSNPDREAMGVCLESRLDGDSGVLATLVVQSGTLNVGDIVVCGTAHGRIRAMADTRTGGIIPDAGPAVPVLVLGFDEPPGAGERFHVLPDVAKARQIAETRQAEEDAEMLSGNTVKVDFDTFQERLAEGTLGVEEDKVELNLIIRADAKGSLEAIRKELRKIDHPEVEIKILQQSVGGVTLADVTLASASEAVIAAFNVIPDDRARSMADEKNVEIRRYDVIYKLSDEIKQLVEGRLKPEEKVVELGNAVVKQTFSISRVGTIAGCYVTQGLIQRGCRIRVARDGRTIGDYQLDTLRRIKDDVKEVPKGMECGIRLQGFNDVKPDDVLEAYRIEEVARTLDG